MFPAQRIFSTILASPGFLRAPIMALLVIAVPLSCWGQSCPKLQKELHRLRLEFHDYATGLPEPGKDPRAGGRTQRPEAKKSDDRSGGEANSSTTSQDTGPKLEFSRLAVMLDTIIELKVKMRAAGCEILSRTDDLNNRQPKSDKARKPVASDPVKSSAGASRSKKPRRTR